MTRHEAVFEIESRSDANAVWRLVEEFHDALREELRGTRNDDGSLDESLQQFERVREAARDPSPGTLTLVYEPREEPFED